MPTTTTVTDEQSQRVLDACPLCALAVDYAEDRDWRHSLHADWRKHAGAEEVAEIERLFFRHRQAENTRREALAAYQAAIAALPEKAAYEAADDRHDGVHAQARPLARELSSRVEGECQYGVLHHRVGGALRCDCDATGRSSYPF